MSGPNSRSVREEPSPTEPSHREVRGQRSEVRRQGGWFRYRGVVAVAVAVALVSNCGLLLVGGLEGATDRTGQDRTGQGN